MTSPTSPQGRRERQQRAAKLLRRGGVVLLVAGAVFRLTSGTLLDRYADYVTSTSDLQYSVASHVFSIVDAMLIPLGVGLLVGGLVVEALRDTGP